MAPNHGIRPRRHRICQEGREAARPWAAEKLPDHGARPTMVDIQRYRRILKTFKNISKHFKIFQNIPKFQNISKTF
jgi:hypothetical protein